MHSAICFINFNLLYLQGAANMGKFQLSGTFALLSSGTQNDTDAKSNIFKQWGPSAWNMHRHFSEITNLTWQIKILTIQHKLSIWSLWFFQTLNSSTRPSGFTPATQLLWHTAHGMAPLVFPYAYSSVKEEQICHKIKSYQILNTITTTHHQVKQIQHLQLSSGMIM